MSLIPATAFALIAQAADAQESEEFNPAGLIFMLPFLAFYTAVAIMYLTIVKRPVKIVSIVVFVVSGFAGAAASMLLYGITVAGGEATASTVVELGYFLTGMVCGLLASIGSLRILWRFLPAYGRVIEDTDSR